MKTQVVDVYTIGFTRKSAKTFFDVLRSAGIRQLLDVRLNNSSQLAGFAKKDDLEFFLAEICNAAYVHNLLLAPTQEMLDEYKKEKAGWVNYQRRFLDLMSSRVIESMIDPALFSVPTVLLCSEVDAAHCHRSLVLDYLNSKWNNILKVTNL